MSVLVYRYACTDIIITILLILTLQFCNDIIVTKGGKITMQYDKSMEYVSQTQTLIGKQRKRLQDLDTGEYIEVDQITKRALGQKQFWKIYLIV